MNLLKSKVLLLLITLVLLFMGSLKPAFAESAIQCHCFKNRSYDPADRFVSDDYILATSFNSLLARTFAVAKKQIVMLKMNQGVAQDELLVALKISKTTGIDVSELLRLRKEKNTWATIVSGIRQQEKIRNDPLLEALRSGLIVEDAGAGIAAEMIVGFYRVTPEEVKELRASGLNEKEINLVFILAHAGKKQPEELVLQYRKKGKSWSEIAHESGLEPAQTGKLILAYPAEGQVE